MLPSFKPKTYQDVKKSLMWYTIILLNIIAILFYFLIFSPTQRNFVSSFMGTIEKPVSLIGPGMSLTFFTFVAWLLISIIEIHDKVYDNYFVKWRYWYSIDFIFPTLFRPFTDNLPNHFFEEAKSHVYDFMKVFYYFVGDYETKININLALRFYEKVTKYWITQINEILLFFSFIVILILKYFGDLKSNIAFNGLVIIIIFYLINRFFVKNTKIPVRTATNDEIEDIHKNHLSELEDELKNLCRKYGLSYGQN